jgi:hypothetical protein
LPDEMAVTPETSKHGNGRGRRDLMGIHAHAQVFQTWGKRIGKSLGVTK